ncbi:Uncharacterised protein [Shigella sonnei]|nr:Uncharacterised protein [Shigella sonnei]
MVNLSSITDHHPFCTFSHQQHGDLILFCQGAYILIVLCFSTDKSPEVVNKNWPPS